MLRPLVLVVESQRLLRMQCIADIQAGGFDTIDVAYADSAVGILESRLGVRVVFTELESPGDLDGIRLGHLMRRHWPLVELVVTGKHRLPTSGELPTKSRFIAKPYTSGDLIHILRGFRLWQPND